MLWRPYRLAHQRPKLLCAGTRGHGRASDACASRVDRPKQWSGDGSSESFGLTPRALRSSDLSFGDRNPILKHALLPSGFHLLLTRSPTAVKAIVVTVVVNPIDGPAGEPSRFHVAPEIFKSKDHWAAI